MSDSENHDDECNIERCTANEKFSIIPNEILQHPTMTADAQTVLTYLLSCKSNWTIKPKNVWKAKNISRDHVYKAFEELIKLGYMCRITTKLDNLKSSVKYKVSYLKKFLRHPESRDTEPRYPESQDSLISTIKDKEHLKNPPNPPKGESGRRVEIPDQDSKEEEKEEYGHDGIVKLTMREYEALLKLPWGGKVDGLIDELALYIGSTGKRYKSHFYTLQDWHARKEKERQKKKTGELREGSKLKFETETDGWKPEGWE